MKMKKIFKGLLGDYCEKVQNVLLYDVDVDQHVGTYIGEHHEWYAEPEFSGKYIDICVRIYEETGMEIALEHAKKVVDSVINNMREDGYIGMLKEGNEFLNFGVWNQAFTIFGMLSYYRITHEKRVLKSCEKCAQYIMNHFVNDGNDILDCINNGTEHPSILLVLSDLYSYTQNHLYIEYAEFILDSFRNSDLNLLEFDSILNLRSKKGIEIFVILLGMLKYAELTDNETIIHSVEKYWQEVYDTQIRNTGNGTLFEIWTENGNAPAMLDSEQKPNETCVAVGWTELSLSLFKITKQTKYANAIDRTLYNHILASISPNGDDFAYYQPNFGNKVRAIDKGQYKCCRYRGFTLFTYMPDMLFFEDDKSIMSVIYTNCEYCSDSVRIIEKTGYPFDCKFAFEIDSYSDKHLKLRLPNGYSIKSFNINDDTQYIINDEYIACFLNTGNHYEINMTLEPQMTIEKGTIDEKNVAAVSCGQALLALIGDSGDVITDIKSLTLPDNLTNENYLLKVAGKAVKNGEVTTITLTDYASADDYTVWFNV
ncbi:MAG: beta-L-arabinofuranosidase domain-containing protein [Monoglobaceae bacterium]